MKASFNDLGSFWTKYRIERLKKLHGSLHRYSSTAIAARMGIRPAEVRRVLALLGVDVPPKSLTLKAPSPAASVQGGVVNNLSRRLQILASATDHTPQQLVDYGWVKNARVGEEEGGDNVS